MPNINAALGCAQLEQLPKLLAAKRIIYNKYKEVFKEIPEISLMSEPKGCKSNYWLQTLKLLEFNIINRNQILMATNNAGVMTRPAWKLMHKLPQFEACPAMDLVVAEQLESQLINIPSSAYNIIWNMAA
jgi:dTDP-4-amino-4,6-dideoxygalactose transaminase